MVGLFIYFFFSFIIFPFSSLLLSLVPSIQDIDFLCLPPGLSWLAVIILALGESLKQVLTSSPTADPGFCNTSLNMVHVRVDMSLPENQDPKPQLEDNEFIECFTVPLTSLFDEMKKLEDEGYAIDARVGTIAEGIELAKRLKL